jgi:acetyl esterase
MNEQPAVTRPDAEQLHAQVQAFLDEGAQQERPPLHTLSPAQARAQVELEVEAIGPGPSIAGVTTVAIAVGDASDTTISARVYEPARSLAKIVWFHGGGWVLGGLDSHDAMCRMIANAAQCTVTSIDYRLAPEHRFPIPLDDCWRALTWVAARDPLRPLVVGGDSAGGNLAAVCALRARDRGGPALSQQVLIYPVTDCDLTNASYEEFGGDDQFLTRKDMAWFFDHYVHDGSVRKSPEVSPLRAPDLSGLPPAVVVTAGHDPLLDEGLAYVGRLRQAGVPVTHRHYGDMTHAFFSFVNVFERGDEAVVQVAQDIAPAIDGTRATRR